MSKALSVCVLAFSSGRMCIDLRSSKKVLKCVVRTLVVFALAVVGVGCCIGSRRMAGSGDIHVLTSGYYRAYSNGVSTVYRECSYVGGPYAGAHLYPATRVTLNALALWDYSSPASGDYMINVITVPLYPLVIVNLPVQLVLDTLLVPFDMCNVPEVPEGFVELRW